MRRLLLAALMFGAGLAQPAAIAPQDAANRWHGYQRLGFAFAGRPAILVRPNLPADGRPWIWRTEFFGHEPQADVALLARGWHVAYLDVQNMYGAPPAISVMADFHQHLVSTYGLAAKAVLEGFSRGGLYAVNFASAHPDKTAALYLDAPVLDLRSWPGGKGKGKGDPASWQQALTLYGLTDEDSARFRGNPLDHAEALARARIAVLSVCGDADDVVPMDENTTPFAQRMRAAGGTIEVITKPGVNHHPHSLVDPQPIVDFIVRYAAPPARR